MENIFFFAECVHFCIKIKLQKNYLHVI